MADKEHVRILRDGRDAWNAWRKENPSTKPNLSGIDLSQERPTYEGFDFSETNFRGARLNGWRVIDCNLYNCDLTKIAAQGSYWRNVRFGGAHITGDFILSNMYSVDFSHAILENCGLYDAELRFLRLNGTRFSPAFLNTHINSWTIIRSDLSGMIKPARGVHEYPSNVDIATLQKTAEGLQEKPEIVQEMVVFFEECGLPPEIVSVFQSWTRAGKTTTEYDATQPDFFSCFISYSHSDNEFARRLHSELTKRGVHCWLDDHQIFPGDDIFDEIDRGIRRWDKVLLCCSKNSLQSLWVDRELEKALQKEDWLWQERGRKTLVVIPLDLDGYLFDWDGGKASAIKARSAADFTDWENDDAKFQNQLEKVLSALDTGVVDRKREPPPNL